MRPIRGFDSSPILVDATTQHTNEDQRCHSRKLGISMWHYQHRGVNEIFGVRLAVIAGTGSGRVTFHSSFDTTERNNSKIVRRSCTRCRILRRKAIADITGTTRKVHPPTVLQNRYVIGTSRIRICSRSYEYRVPTGNKSAAFKQAQARRCHTTLFVSSCSDGALLPA